MILLTEELLRRQANDAIQLALEKAGWDEDTKPTYGPGRYATEQVVEAPVRGKLRPLHIRRYRERGDIYAFALRGVAWAPVDMLWYGPFQVAFTWPEEEATPDLIWIYRWTPRTVPTPLSGEPLTSASLNAVLKWSAMVLEEIGDELAARPGPCEGAGGVEEPEEPEEPEELHGWFEAQRTWPGAELTVLGWSPWSSVSPATNGTIAGTGVGMWMDSDMGPAIPSETVQFRVRMLAGSTVGTTCAVGRGSSLSPLVQAPSVEVAMLAEDGPWTDWSATADYNEVLTAVPMIVGSEGVSIVRVEVRAAA